MNEGWPERMLRIPVKETVVRLAHVALDQFRHEGLSDHHSAPVPVLKGVLKPVMRFPHDSEGTYLQEDFEGQADLIA